MASRRPAVGAGTDPLTRARELQKRWERLLAEGALGVDAPLRREPLPDDTEDPLGDFTELVATAIANAETRRELLQVATEQQALRRAATMVASGASPTEVFAAITASAAELFDVPFATLLRYGHDDTAEMVAGCAACSEFVGRTWTVPVDDHGITRTVLDSCRPARVEDHSRVRGPLGEAARALGVGSVVGVPVTVDGSIWGVLAVGAAKAGTTLPEDASERLVGFTELVSTAIANSESREKVTRLLNEQAALRRVATLVADEVEPGELFSAVSDEVAQLFEVTGAAVGRFEPGGSGVIAAGLSEGLRGIAVGTRTALGASLASTEVYRTGRAVRKDVRGDDIDAADAIGEKLRELRFYSTVAAPIVVGGSLWGVLVAVSADATLPVDTEEQLEKFGELVATAIANAESRAELAASEARALALADEQAALRRVATLVADGISAEELFVAVCDEAATLVNAEITTIGRFDRDEPYDITVVGMSSDYRDISIGTRSPRMEWLASSEVFRTGRTARRDVTAREITDSHPVADSVRAMGFFSTVSAPIVVEGELWGVVTASSPHRSLPPSTERRVESFGELVATAIANADSRAELATSEARARALASEQAALRRVATLVAQGAAPHEVFDAVRREVAEAFDVRYNVLWRYDPDGFATVMATARGHLGPVGRRWRIDGDSSVAAVVRQTGRPARVDFTAGCHPRGLVAEAALREGMRSGVGVPIIVEGRLWGAMVVGSQSTEPQPVWLEHGLARFTELLATAISNAESREQVARLAAEQAALRRVATLVAQGAEPRRVFAAVAEEAAGIVDMPVVGVNRYEADGTIMLLGLTGDFKHFTVGSNLGPVGEKSAGVAAMILTSGRSARFDAYRSEPGPNGETVGDLKVSTVGVPIVVDATIWGFMIAADRSGKPIPAGIEERLTRFTELVATAVSNATTHSELLTSRARLVSAADETRRRLERDLHDGIQQWLVALALKARKAAGLSKVGESVTGELSGLADDLVAVTDELREISRGIHPAILSDAGLDDALDALARRSAIQVDLDVRFRGRYEPTLEATMYYVAAESITNAVKHSHASRITVRGGRRDATIELEIRDDGVGGADPRRGTGLIGLKDRVDTLGGTISFASPAGAGTTIRVGLPGSLRDEYHELGTPPRSG